MSHTIKIQSMSDIITNSSSEVFLVSAKDIHKDTFMSPEDIVDALKRHAKRHRNPYADWKIEEDRANGLEDKTFNSINNDPDGYLQCMTLFDAFWLYTIKTKRDQTTPGKGNKTAKPWRQVSVDEVIESIREDEERLNLGVKFDETNVLVELDHKLDKTEKWMKTIFDTVLLEDIPCFIDFLDFALYDDARQRKSEFFDEEVYDFCVEKYKKWLEEKKQVNKS